MGYKNPKNSLPLISFLKWFLYICALNNFVMVKHFLILLIFCASSYIYFSPIMPFVCLCPSFNHSLFSDYKNLLNIKDINQVEVFHLSLKFCLQNFWKSIYIFIVCGQSHIHLYGFCLGHYIYIKFGQYNIYYIRSYPKVTYTFNMCTFYHPRLNHQ